MDNYQKRVTAAMRRGRWYLRKYVEQIGATFVAQMLAQLDTAIVGIDADATEKVRADQFAESDTVAKYAIRRKLLDAMGPVCSAAQEGLVDVTAPEITKFILPYGNVSDVTLIASARAVADAAAAYKDAFVQNGRPADFVEALQGLADDLENRIMGRDGNRLDRRRARAGINVKLAKARSLLRTLSRTVEERLRPYPDLIVTWRAAIRIGGPHATDVPDEGQDVPATPAAPASPGAPVAAAGPALVADQKQAAA